MLKLSTVLCLVPVLSNCIVYIDRVTKDFNPKVLIDFTVEYTHNSNGDAVVNVTIVSVVTITKLLAYGQVRLPENKDDREYRREFIRTVFDVTKTLNGSQSNFLVKFFCDNVMKYADFEMKFPVGPVGIRNIQFQLRYESFCHQGTYRIVNAIVDSAYLPFPQDLPGVIDIRLVIKTPKIIKHQYLLKVSFYGGF